MICKNCVIAGRLTAEGRTGHLAAHQIAYWHSRCLAPTTCPCQHKLPEV